jgi:hypothetical protein
LRKFYFRSPFIFLTDQQSAHRNTTINYSLQLVNVMAGVDEVRGRPLII